MGKLRIALIGYGKMGKAIEQIALDRGHQISLKINTASPIEEADFSNTDVAIEFSRPDAVLNHIDVCLQNGIPVVVGTTAWNESLETVKSKVSEHNGALLHASNFSVGVNIFFELNKLLARLMASQPSYQADIEEIHHLQKLDAPSGTAITIANGLMNEHSSYNKWILGEEEVPEVHSNELPIISYRKPDVPGTHIVTYRSEVDTIQISHEAHNRTGFALGAVLSAEFLVGKKGTFTMSDVLKITI